MNEKLEQLIARRDGAKLKAQSYREIEASTTDSNKRVGAATAAKFQEVLAKDLTEEISHLMHPPPRWQFWKYWGRSN